MIPTRHLGGSIRFLDAARRPLDLASGSIHHRNETLVRAADPWLLAHAARAAGQWTLAARAGLSLPLGRTEENPFELGRRGLPHQHFQFGRPTGRRPQSWHALAGADLAREQSETWRGRREEGGNLGRTDVLLGLGVARSLRAGSLSLSLRVPIVTRAQSAQLDYPVIVSIGWSSGR